MICDHRYGIRSSAKELYVQIDDVNSSMLSINTGVPQGSIVGPLLFNILINDIIMSSDKFNFILYADDTTLNATVESFGETAADIQISIRNELQKIICKWLDLNKLRINVAKSKFMFFSHASENNSTVTFLSQLGLLLTM